SVHTRYKLASVCVCMAVGALLILPDSETEGFSATPATRNGVVATDTRDTPVSSLKREACRVMQESGRSKAVLAMA
ncbi:MAG: hypothetical protein WBG80_07300, partial [Bacteroidota bacterium]